MHNCKFHQIIQRKILILYRSTSVSTNFLFPVLFSYAFPGGHLLLFSDAGPVLWKEMHVCFSSLNAAGMEEKCKVSSLYPSWLEVKERGLIFSAL